MDPHGKSARYFYDIFISFVFRPGLIGIIYLPYPILTSRLPCMVEISSWIIGRLLSSSVLKLNSYGIFIANPLVAGSTLWHTVDTVLVKFSGLSIFHASDNTIVNYILRFFSLKPIAVWTCPNTNTSIFHFWCVEF